MDLSLPGSIQEAECCRAGSKIPGIKSVRKNQQLFVDLERSCTGGASEGKSDGGKRNSLPGPLPGEFDKIRPHTKGFGIGR